MKPVAKYFRKRTGCEFFLKLVFGPLVCNMSMVIFIFVTKKRGEVLLRITRTAYSHLLKGFECVVPHEVTYWIR